jgi:hypothetical protein
MTTFAPTIADATQSARSQSPVRAAIASASRATGMDFDFLLSTAVRESSLNPTAEAPTSSAAGLFQFLDQTWLTTVKRHGARHGMGAEAAMVQIGSDGRARVDDAQARAAILNMRFDPELSARMAAEFASDNADALRVRTGREPVAGDLYAAHFLGASGAAQLINAASDQPWEAAANLFPQAARANRPIFYAPDGRPKTVVEVLGGLRATAMREAPPVSQVEFAGAGRWAAQSGNQAVPGAGLNPALAAALEAQSQAERQLLALIGSDAGGAGSPFSALLGAGLVQTALDGRGMAGGDPGLYAQMLAQQDAAIEQAGADIIESGRTSGSIATALSPSADRTAQNRPRSPDGGSRGDSSILGMAAAGQADAPPAAQSQPQFAALQARQDAQAMPAALMAAGAAPVPLRGRSIR